MRTAIAFSLLVACACVGADDEDGMWSGDRADAVAEPGDEFLLEWGGCGEHYAGDCAITPVFTGYKAIALGETEAEIADEIVAVEYDQARGCVTLASLLASEDRRSTPLELCPRYVEEGVLGDHLDGWVEWDPPGGKVDFVMWEVAASPRPRRL